MAFCFIFVYSIIQNTAKNGFYHSVLILSADSQERQALENKYTAKTGGNAAFSINTAC